MSVQDDDKFIVNRGGTDYKVSAFDFLDKLQDTDYTLTHRNGVDYKLNGKDLREYLTTPPPEEFIVSKCYAPKAIWIADESQIPDPIF